MKDEEPIDFSPLDPARDAARWDKLIDAVAARATQALRSSSVPMQLVAWTRPVLGLAAAAALFVWSGAILSKPMHLPQFDKESAWDMAFSLSEQDLLLALQVLGERGEIDETR